MDLGNSILPGAVSGSLFGAHVLKLGLRACRVYRV